MGSLITQPQFEVIKPQFELIKTPSFSEEVIKTFGGKPLWKIDETTHTVYGLSTAEVPDSDNEVASYPDSKRNYNKWGEATAAITRAAGQEVSFGNIRCQHTSEIGGKATRIDYLDDKKQIWLLTQPVDDQVWSKLVGGFFTGYSHAGRYEFRRCILCGYDIPAGNYCPQCQKMIAALYAPVLSEVSYVDRPCLGIATFAYVKADGSVEMRKFVAPAAKKVLVDIRELAAMFTANFTKAIEDIGKVGINRATGAPPDGDGSNINDFLDVDKQARTEVGQFSNNVSGPEHEALVGSGFEHKTTCSDSGERTYQHPGGAKVTLGTDGSWQHDDGTGRISSGTGTQAIAIHLAACNKAAADSAGKDTATMKDEDVKEFVKTIAADILSAAFGVRFVDGKVVPVEVAPAQKACKKEEMECPECGDTITFDSDDDDDSVPCPGCGAEVSVKNCKAKKSVKVIILRKDMSHLGRMADILQAMRYLQQYVVWEGEGEKDPRDFAIAESLSGLINEGVRILGDIFTDETSEITQPLAIPALKAATDKKENNLMKVEELLNKAAKALKDFFGKAAANHEKLAAFHKGLVTENTEKMAKAEGEAKGELEKAVNLHKADAEHHEQLAKACKDAIEAIGGETAKADSPADLTKALGDTQMALSTAIDAKLEPITKALGALDGIATIGERLGKVEAAVEKFGNETLPTVVKGAGAALISREGKELEPPAGQSPSGGLF